MASQEVRYKLCSHGHVHYHSVAVALCSGSVALPQITMHNSPAFALVNEGTEWGRGFRK
jgi:hypothetical protein